ncbi:MULTISPECIES: DUF3800 domain-containing protein [unclassified Sphingomonas]|uniref:DUF3800 domain-containing protein n=1 Tax=unclassified Sphingomonas TaxID=196159 RepID=UPI0006F67543|nr:MULTISPECIES: DUF3800 domain-containing protein [unclassified Sphingomonas]KQM24584.1 hypothetical protein ASE58_14245 [Sphingomonas sp. Leaf9]
MQIAFLDEFGHCGPYVSRTDPKYNTSPVFGLAGYVMPAANVRHFATFFYQLKQFMLAADIKAAGVHPATWEKKGAKLLTTKNIRKYPHVREGVNRLLNELYKCNGRIIYYGREKYKSPEESNSGGLYNTVMGHSIRAIDRYCGLSNSPFLMILDQHSSRIKLLEAASKTMFGSEPARYLLEPPFEVESHLYQTVQAADWIATLVGRIEARRAKPDEYEAWEWAERLFGNKIDALATHSRMWRPSRAI